MYARTHARMQHAHTHTHTDSQLFAVVVNQRQLVERVWLVMTDPYLN